MKTSHWLLRRLPYHRSRSRLCVRPRTALTALYQPSSSRWKMRPSQRFRFIPNQSSIFSTTRSCPRQRTLVAIFPLSRTPKGSGSSARRQIAGRPATITSSARGATAGSWSATTRTSARWTSTSAMLVSISRLEIKTCRRKEYTRTITATTGRSASSALPRGASSQ